MAFVGRGGRRQHQGLRLERRKRRPRLARRGSITCVCTSRHRRCDQRTVAAAGRLTGRGRRERDVARVLQFVGAGVCVGTAQGERQASRESLEGFLAGKEHGLGGILLVKDVRVL